MMAWLCGEHPVPWTRTEAEAKGFIHFFFFLMPKISSLDVHLDMKGHSSWISKSEGNPL